MTSPRRKISRREFLEWLGAACGLALAGCAPKLPSSTPATTRISATATLTPSTTAIPARLPTDAPTALPAATQLPEQRPVVGIARAASYDPALIRARLESLLDGPGGLGDLIRPGARVGIKANLTGGPWWDEQVGLPATETFVTHPTVVQVLGELCRDAGAASLYIFDGIAEEASWKLWGYTAAATALDARLINLCKPAPYRGYTIFPVGPRHLVYESFTLNPLLGELDLLVSVAKMKTHATTGVTLTMKNLVGLTPMDRYKRKESDTMRSALHHTVNGYDDRMPRVVVDLNLACRVGLGVIDGVITCEGAAGPWDTTLHQVRPGLLFAGRNPVVVDAVATGVMGFDPDARVHTRPFLGGENHLALAREAGLGTNRMEDIQVVGEQIEDARFPFKLVGE